MTDGLIDLYKIKLDIHFIFIFHRVIIGAPQADISHVQRDVKNGGAVYRCHTNEDNRCWLIQFDSKGKI